MNTKAIFCLFFLITLAAFMNGCGPSMTKAEVRSMGLRRMEDPSVSLWITVDSFPTGAEVYGINNDQAGTRIGTTPITMKYTRIPGGYTGTLPGETIILKEKNSGPFSLSKAHLAFKCMVLKEGYHPYKIYQVVEDSGGSWRPFAKGHVKALDGGVHKTYTAVLRSIALPISPAISLSPMELEQKQAAIEDNTKPTIVMPDEERSKLEQNLIFEDNVNVIWRAAKNVRVVSVGVSDFKDSQIPQVKYARSDAQNIASFFILSGIPEENITSLINEYASRNDITDALIRLKMATTEPSETAIFYFSGHGAPIVKDGKIIDAVLVPYDAMESSLEYTSIKVSMLKEMLSDMRGNTIVILDACFSGKEGRSLMTKNVKAIAVVPKDFNIVQGSGKKNWWLTATSGDNFANDFDKRNSGLFTYYFLKALNGEKGVDANKDGLISIKEAFSWSKKEIQAVSSKSLGQFQAPELIGKGDTILTIPK